MIKQTLAVLAASAALATPIFAASLSTTMPQPVACQTKRELFELLNAEDRHDTKEEARLTAGACRPIAGLHYEVVSDENGIATIRIFAHEGDWASSHLAFTLDEMVAAN